MIFLLEFLSFKVMPFYSIKYASGKFSTLNKVSQSNVVTYIEGNTVIFLITKILNIFETI